MIKLLHEPELGRPVFASKRTEKEQPAQQPRKKLAKPLINRSPHPTACRVASPQTASPMLSAGPPECICVV